MVKTEVNEKTFSDIAGSNSCGVNFHWNIMGIYYRLCIQFILSLNPFTEKGFIHPKPFLSLQDNYIYYMFDDSTIYLHWLWLVVEKYQSFPFLWLHMYNLSQSLLKLPAFPSFAKIKFMRWGWGLTHLATSCICRKASISYKLQQCRAGVYITHDCLLRDLCIYQPNYIEE